MDRPNIIEVINKYVPLRKRGKEFIGCCPFHADKHPSFSVSEEKQVFHCFGCGESGNVINFVMKIENLSFKEARSALGMDGTPPRRPTPPRRAAVLLADWLNCQYRLIGARCRHVSRQIALAAQIPNAELVESLESEFEILADLHDDLANPAFAAELWEARESIEALTAEVEPEPLPDFPPLTDAYRARLKELFKC